jgi:hypothetical protein
VKIKHTALHAYIWRAHAPRTQSMSIILECMKISSKVVAIALVMILYLCSVAVLYVRVDSANANVERSRSAEYAADDVRRLTWPGHPSVADEAEHQGWRADENAIVSYVDWLDPRHATARYQFDSLDSAVEEFRTGSSDDASRQATDHERKRRVCLVTWEYEELLQGGGIGTGERQPIEDTHATDVHCVAFTALARTLARAGFNVTVLLNRDDPVDATANVVRDWAEWQAFLMHRDGIAVHEPSSAKTPGLDKVSRRGALVLVLICAHTGARSMWLSVRVELQRVPVVGRARRRV